MTLKDGSANSFVHGGIAHLGRHFPGHERTEIVLQPQGSHIVQGQCRGRGRCGHRGRVGAGGLRGGRDLGRQWGGGRGRMGRLLQRGLVCLATGPHQGLAP